MLKPTFAVTAPAGGSLAVDVVGGAADALDYAFGVAATSPVTAAARRRA